MLLIVVNVDWGRKSRLLCVQDLLRQFEARREATEDGNINNFSKSNGGREGKHNLISDLFCLIIGEDFRWTFREAFKKKPKS